MYAATAYILIEAGDIIMPRLGLPEWTVTFLIILIIAGFPITIIISWIYDISPKGIEKTDSKVEKSDSKAQEPDSPAKKKHLLNWGNAIIGILLVVVCILLYPKLFKKDKFEAFRDDQGRISLAVLPFENLTGDSTLNYFQRGIASNLSNDLGNSPQLSVRDEQSVFELTNNLGEVNYAGFNPSNAMEMARVLKAGAYLSGSYQGRNENYLILVDLIDAETGDKLWTDRVKGNLETSEYFDMADSLSRKVKDHLEIKVMKKKMDKDLREAYTNSSEAYRYYREGMDAFMNKQEEHAIQALTRALEFDPDFTLAKFYIAWAYNTKGQNDSCGVWTSRAYETKTNLPHFYQDWLELWHACGVTKNIKDVNKICRELSHSETDSRFFWYDLGVTQLTFLNDHKNALISFEKVERISAEREANWNYYQYYRDYARALHLAGDHQKEKKITAIGKKLHPTPGYLHIYEVACAASQGQWEVLNGHLREFRQIWEEYGIKPKVQEYYTARIFEYAELPDSAIAHHQLGWEMDPDDPYRIFTYGRSLINYDKDIQTGLDLLETIQDYPGPMQLYLFALGNGYYKMGRIEDALEKYMEAKEISPTASLELEQSIEEAREALKKRPSS